MNKRQKIGLLIIIIALLIIAGVIYFFFMNNPGIIATPENTDQEIVQLPTDVDESITPGNRPRNNMKYDITKEAEHQINATDVAKIAAAFAERLGSYSNQSNYANFEDLNIFMTASMRAWALEYVNKMKSDNPYDGNYYGVTSKAVGTRVVSFDDDKATAEIVITTQRQEVIADGSEKIFNQDLRLTFVKENNQWLVDGAYWLK